MENNEKFKKFGEIVPKETLVPGEIELIRRGVRGMLGGEIDEASSSEVVVVEGEFDDERDGLLIDMAEKDKDSRIEMYRNDYFAFFSRIELENGLVGQNDYKRLRRKWNMMRREKEFDFFGEVVDMFGKYIEDKSNLSSLLAKGGNCEARAKLVICFMQDFFPKIETKLQFFSNHVRVLAKKDGVYYSIELPYVKRLREDELEGTALVDSDAFVLNYFGKGIEVEKFGEGEGAGGGVTDSIFDFKELMEGLAEYEGRGDVDLEGEGGFSGDWVLEEMFFGLSRLQVSVMVILTLILGLSLGVVHKRHRLYYRESIWDESKVSRYGEYFLSLEKKSQMPMARKELRDLVREFSKKVEQLGDDGFKQVLEEINRIGVVDLKASPSLSQYLIEGKGDSQARAKFLVSVISAIYPKVKFYLKRFKGERQVDVYVKKEERWFIMARDGVREVDGIADKKGAVSEKRDIKDFFLGALASGDKDAKNIDDKGITSKIVYKKRGERRRKYEVKSFGADFDLALAKDAIQQREMIEVFLNKARKTKKLRLNLESIYPENVDFFREKIVEVLPNIEVLNLVGGDFSFLDFTIMSRLKAFYMSFGVKVGEVIDLSNVSGLEDLRISSVLGLVRLELPNQSVLRNLRISAIPSLKYLKMGKGGSQMSFLEISDTGLKEVDFRSLKRIPFSLRILSNQLLENINLAGVDCSGHTNFFVSGNKALKVVDLRGAKDVSKWIVSMISKYNSSTVKILRK